MGLRSAFDKDFLALANDWLQINSELFVVIRYAYAAGAKDYLFVHSFEEFETLLKKLPPRADVIVFRHKYFPLRGVANDALLDQSLQEIPDGQGWMIIDTAYGDPDCMGAWGGESHEELRTEFEDFRDRNIAIGLEPSWWKDDNADMQSARIPLPDGTLESGAY